VKEETLLVEKFLYVQVVKYCPQTKFQSSPSALVCN